MNDAQLKRHIVVVLSLFFNIFGEGVEESRKFFEQKRQKGYLASNEFC
jgi:hypothetical protein